MPIFKILKSQGGKMTLTPKDIGTMIVDNIPENELIDLYQVADAGFINIFLKSTFGEDVLTNLLLEGMKPPRLMEKKRVLVDFSSPNIAKEMHVGHLR